MEIDNPHSSKQKLQYNPWAAPTKPKTGKTNPILIRKPIQPNTTNPILMHIKPLQEIITDI